MDIKNYIPVSQKIKEWGKSKETICQLCREGKIDGAVKIANTWWIPQKLEYPITVGKRSMKKYYYLDAENLIVYDVRKLDKDDEVRDYITANMKAITYNELYKAREEIKEQYLQSQTYAHDRLYNKDCDYMDMNLDYENEDDYILANEMIEALDNCIDLTEDCEEYKNLFKEIHAYE